MNFHLICSPNDFKNLMNRNCYLWLLIEEWDFSRIETETKTRRLRCRSYSTWMLCVGIWFALPA